MRMLERETFSHYVDSLYQAQESTALQRRFWDSFKRLGLPTLRSESFRTYPLRSLYQMEGVYPRIERNCPERHPCQIVLVDGALQKELSDIPEALIVLPIKEAWIKYRSILEGRLQRQCESEKNPFFLMHTALASEGIFCYLPPNAKIDQPLKISSLHQSQVAFPKIFFFLGKEAEAQVHLSGESSGHFHHLSLDFFLDEGASLKWIHDDSKLHATHQFDSLRADLKRDAQLNHFAFTQNGRHKRSDLVVNLLGENSEVALRGLALLDEKNERHQHVLVRHSAPHARSLQHYKSICDGHSRSHFEGKIFVERAAQKTEAYQLSNHLLLSSSAIAHSKPGLEIFADDVKASHGATCSQLNSSQLLYLMMRGLSQKEAQSLLVQAFGIEMTTHIFEASVREAIRNKLKLWGENGKKTI